MVKRLYYIIFISIILSSCHDNTSEPEQKTFEWSISTPESQKMNSQTLDSAFYHARRLGFVDGLVIIKNGYLVGECYYNGFNQRAPHYIWSCTKSFLSAVVGIALKQGVIESLDKKVMDYFPEYAYPGMDPRFYDVTIRHLITMKMGIGKEEKILIPVMQTDNWIRETLRLPLLFDPGTSDSYNSLQQHLISAIITKQTGMDLLSFTRVNLTSKMGIQIPEWKRDPMGYNIGGFGIYMTPRDMAVLGYLYLHKGKLNNFQIVPSDWIDSSFVKRRAQDGKEWGSVREYNYGYQWWIGKMNGYKIFMAMGMGGQFIISFPDLNLIVVAVATENVSWDNNHEVPILNLISDYIVTAVE